MRVALHRAGFNCHIFKIWYYTSPRIIAIFEKGEGIGFSLTRVLGIRCISASNKSLHETYNRG